MSTAAWQITGLAVLAGALFGLAAWILSLREIPLRREHNRRLNVNSRGRLGAGVVMDVGPNVTYYAYTVGGVDYRASQDVTDFAGVFAARSDGLIGPVMLKYLQWNPANSIVVCELWSGLRTSNKEIVSR